MTLKTIARFELALGINIVPKVTVSYSKELPFLSSNESLRKHGLLGTSVRPRM